jgi:hypothetical protein
MEHPVAHVRSRLRRPAVVGVAAALLALAVLGTACEKNNDVIARQQIEQANDACPRGCEVPPPGCTIKGNVSIGGNKIYHLQSQASWSGIRIQIERGERWFCNEQEAINNGFRKSIN